MTEPSTQVPRPAVRFVAVGLFLMAIFTLLWAAWAVPGLPRWLGATVLAIGVLAGVAFVVNGVQLLRRIAAFPPVAADADARGRSTRRGWGVSFAVEGVVVGIVAAILGRYGLFAYFAPAIALVVGLHFLPFAKIFRRRLDLVIGGWVIAWALLGLVLLATGHGRPGTIVSAVAAATAAGTIAYGVSMIRTTRRLLAGVGINAAG